MTAAEPRALVAEVRLLRSLQGRMRWSWHLAGLSLLALASPDEGRPQTGGEVAGRVVLVGGDEGVPGVRVGIPGLGVEAVSDVTGAFHLRDVSSGAHAVRFDLVGCRGASVVVDVGPGPPAQVRLVLDGPAVAPSETVEAGTGVPTPEALLPFSVGRLERADIERDPGRSIADLIRGSFPGVKVVQGSGAPGDPLSIQLRGPASVTGRQEPLIVLDGVPTAGGVDDLDPLDVERIEVLKGSAAAAMFGARGHAGVIQITMRRAVGEARCFLRILP